MIEVLTRPGYEVPGIHSGAELMQHLSGEFPDTQQVTADATEESGSRDLHVGQFGGASVMIVG